MTSINAYINSLKNITPSHLDAALEESPLTSQHIEEILHSLWLAQRETSKTETKASELPFLNADDLDAGQWIEFFDLKGKLTDAFKDQVGIVEQQRIMIVVDGKIQKLNPDDQVVLYRTPVEPDEI